MESHIVTPGPYRATKLWNEVTKLFRAGMPLKKHRQSFRLHGSCFTATAAADWLHELLRNNSNFGPDVTRQQTVQLLQKFLKNHVIEDVKGRWGTEDLEDNGQLYRFPSTSPLKPIPSGPLLSRKKSISMDREGFFPRFRGSKRYNKATQENVDPLANQQPTDPAPADVLHRRELTDDDILDVWRTITLTHLQKTLGVTSLDSVLDLSQVNVQHIVYNMTHVNKHGVVTLEDKTGDLPHWALSAMKCLANWPKYDSKQPSYPGFERDVFRTVSDYFVNLPHPLLTFAYYELFVNVLVLCGYMVVPKTRHGKRKSQDNPTCPQLSKTPHLSGNAFRSTECLLLSLIRMESQEETESPMREVFGSRPRSCYLEGDAAILPRSGAHLRCHSIDCLTSGIHGNGETPFSPQQPSGSLSSLSSCPESASHIQTSASCFSINAPLAEIPVKPDCTGVLQPALERVAVEALQLCTLLLPPANRRKLQLLMRMVSRMSQNVDMPRLHDAIGTRTLMVHTFSRCVLRCEDEVDLDELLATRLVSFLLDHHQDILQVPVYLQNAVNDHISYLKKVQVTYPDTGLGLSQPAYSFCRQISAQEFEEQKLSVSQAAIAELLEGLIKDKMLSVKEKKKKLKQFQKQYPDIYSHRFPTTESEAQLFLDKPKIKPPMLIGMKRPKSLNMRN